MTLEADWDFFERWATRNGVSSEAFRKWGERGRIPVKHRRKILRSAQLRGQEIAAISFDSIPPRKNGSNGHG